MRWWRAACVAVVIPFVSQTLPWNDYSLTAKAHTGALRNDMLIPSALDIQELQNNHPLVLLTTRPHHSKADSNTIHQFGNRFIASRVIANRLKKFRTAIRMATQNGDWSCSQLTANI